MFYDVKNADQALVYIADCNLATVSHLASLKSRSIGEYNRQTVIAQHCVDWIKRFDIDPDKTRAEEVLNNFGGSVKKWAAQYDIRKIK